MGNVNFSTIADPPTSTIPFSLTLTDPDLTLIIDGNGYTLVLDNEPGNIYGPEIAASSSVTFPSVTSISAGTVGFTVTDTTLLNTWSGELSISAICYAEGSLILCLVDGTEQYVKVEELTTDMLVKTYNHGFKKIIASIKDNIRSTNMPGLASLYKLPKDALGENMPFQDLYVTGGHSILVDTMDDNVFNILKNMWGNEMNVEDKYRLLASKSELFELPHITKKINIYHPILENEDESAQYGIYANGILSESTCINLYKKIYVNISHNC